MKNPSLLVSLAAVMISQMSADAALVVTNGGFGTDSVNALYIDGAAAGSQNDPLWFESTVATNWTEGSWTNVSAGTFPAGSGPALLFDGSGAGLGWAYQSLGLVDASEIASGILRVTADFAEKLDGDSNAAQFDILVGAAGAFTGADGTDVLGGGLSLLGTATLSSAQQGLTAAAGDASRQSGVLVGDFNISGLTAGQQLWLRVAESRSPSFTTGDLILDNLTATVVPEPSAILLGGLGLLGLLRRRR